MEKEEWRFEGGGFGGEEDIVEMNELRVRCVEFVYSDAGRLKLRVEKIYGIDIRFMINQWLMRVGVSRHLLMLAKTNCHYHV